MKIARFINIVSRYWFFLLAIPVILICTFLLVKDIPLQYRSTSIISTGIPGESGQVLNMQNGVFAESNYSKSAANLPGLIKLKQVVDQVSYALIIHDLTNAQPFRKPGKMMRQLTPESKKYALRIYQDKLNKHEALNLVNPAEKGLYMVIQSMGYDDSTLIEKLQVYRKSDNDFIYVDFASENPELSAFVVNNLTNAFLRYYTLIAKENQLKESEYLGSLMQQKYASLNQKIDSLAHYKIHHNIIDPNGQGSILYENLQKVNAEKEQAQKQLQAYDGAIRSIDSSFSAAEKEKLNASIAQINEELLDIKSQLNTLNNQRLEGNYNIQNHTGFDSLQQRLAGRIARLTDQYLPKPLAEKRNLVNQKITLETQRDLTRNHLRTLTSKVNNIQGKYNSLVPYDAQIQAHEIHIDIATREYFEIMNNYVQSNLALTTSIPLRQIQAGIAGIAQSSPKVNYLLYSTLAAILLCMLIYLSIYFFDHSISSASELAYKTDQPVLGYLNKLPLSFAGMYNIWYTNDSSPALNEQKRLLRSVRFEIDQLLANKNNNNVVAITSLLPQEGKSFLAINLAYAFAMMKKEVMLIDGNFKNPVITNTLHPSQYIEDIFETGHLNFKSEGLLITVAGNRGMESSVLEVGREEIIKQFFDKLPFDVIIIETEALNTDNRAKEWLIFSSAIVSLFNAGHTITPNDQERISFLNNTGRFGGWVINNAPNKLKAQMPFKKYYQTSEPLQS